MDYIIKELERESDAPSLGGEVVCAPKEPPVEVVGFEGFRVFEMKAGQMVLAEHAFKNHIMILLAGQGHYELDGGSGTVSGDEMLLVPYGADFSLTCTAVSKLVLLTFNTLLSETEQQLARLTHKHGASAGRPVCRLLPLNQAVRKFWMEVQTLCEEELLVPWYTRHKRMELIGMMLAMYEADSLLSFFAPLMDSQSGFRHQVLKICDTALSIDDLVAKTGLCRTNFYRRFGSEFGIPVHRWMQLRRAYAVCEEAFHPAASVKKLMEAHGFTSPSNFIRFCRMYFGCTPNELIQHCRGGRLVRVSEERPVMPDYA